MCSDALVESAFPDNPQGVGAGGVFELRPGAGMRLPVLLSAPHSGRCYPRSLLEGLALPAGQLRPLDDGPVDVVLAPAAERSAGLLVALLPRAWIDLNRSPAELDPSDIEGLVPWPTEITAKVRAGLGLVPSRIGGHRLMRRPLRADEIAQRLATVHRPFHQELARQLTCLQARHGVAVLLDCHSMPRASVTASGPPVEIVVGDHHGASASRAVTELALSVLRRHGFRVATNRPFAGGHITGTCGRPEQGLHALQIELRRDLFLDERDYRLHGGMAALGAALADVVTTLGELALRLPGRSAAA